MVPQEGELNRARVLVVDDDHAMRFLMGEALQQNGFQVVMAQHGREALALFESQRPDIVLLDVMMPEMDGFEVCAAIRSRPGGRHLPILMVTGVDDLDSIQHAYEAGATDFITKPINWLILSERIRYMLRASSTFLELRRNQEMLADAQRIARLGSWVHDLETAAFSCSEQIRSMCALPAAACGTRWEEFLERVHPEDRGRVDELFQQALHRGKPLRVDHRILLPDGSERIVSQHVEVELTDDGTPCRVSGTLQDITERKQAELLEADRNSILQMIIQDEPLPNILNRLLQVIERQRPEAVGALALIQDDQIKVSAAPRLPQPLAQAMDGLPIGVEAGSCGLAAYLGQTVVTVDISTDPYWLKCRDAALASGIQAACSVPIFSGKGRVLGTIALYHRRPHQPSEEDLRLIEKLAQLAAVAIEQRHLSELLMHQAQHDALTGLLNRRAMSQYLSRSLSQTARYGLNGAILLIDLDRFKRINDSLGHQVGDLLLNQVADRLKGCTRKSDTLGRIGGDEFVLVMSAISSQRDAVKAAERILEHINKPFQVQGHQLHIGASIGISLYPHDGSDAAVIQRNADIAMYVAKNDGGNRFHFFNEEMNVAAIQRLEIENDLRKGIERGEFVLHYQPQYNLQTGRLIALEALIRWNHPEYGRIPPNKFIPVAEESRLIIPIGAWVIREACRQNAAWQAQGYPPVRVAVNVSAVQFTETDFAQTVANALKESGLAPEWLEIEITETVILKDKEVVHLNLAKLKEMGLITTIDDFGTGYSSITYLRQMPLDCLKIDRSFIREMVGDDASAQRTQTLVRAFVALAHNLNLNLVAEGIESIDQCGFLSEVGCAMGQGFLFSAPVPPDEIKTLLKEGKREPCPGIPEGSGRAKDNQEGVQGVR